MVSGTDEHGTPVMVAADKEGKSVGEIADYYNQSFREDFQRLGLSYDLFSRTTTHNHELVVQDLFRTLYEHGAIVEREMLVSFSPATGHTLPDRYIEGTCPICGYAEARGDQCDNCGNQLDPTDLINPRSRIDGSTPEFRETKHLFLDLPQFAERLREWIGSHDDWRTNVRNFSLALIDDLRARPITRDLDWGVPIPVPGYAEDTEQAHLRLVRRGDRVPVGIDRMGGIDRRPRGLARMVAEPRIGALLLPGQGQHRLPHRDLAGDAARLRRGRRLRRRPRPARPAGERRRHRVPDLLRQAVLDEPGARDQPARLPRPVRRRRTPLLPGRREPGDAGHRLHLGRVRAPQ